MISRNYFNIHCIHFWKKFKFFSEEVLQCMSPNETCDSLCQMSTSLSVVTVNECPITERQPGTVHICTIVLYF